MEMSLDDVRGGEQRRAQDRDEGDGGGAVHVGRAVDAADGVQLRAAGGGESWGRGERGRREQGESVSVGNRG